ncbi:F-box protein At5g67140-like [Chenopodium quinoa]|uniref:F-box protein At5g67140-like n=1 Tax=Chenopodium quinoa TaxID=63459 RepID=UPI000B76D59C|nr:F-box protein At5g67140-like [Chenopodium quinoa]
MLGFPGSLALRFGPIIQRYCHTVLEKGPEAEFFEELGPKAMVASEMGEIMDIEESEIEKLPTDLLSHIFLLFSSFTDLAQASCVCKKWREGVKQSMGRRQSLSFSGCKMDDASTSCLVHLAFSLKELDMSQEPLLCSTSTLAEHLSPMNLYLPLETIVYI